MLVDAAILFIQYITDESFANFTSVTVRVNFHQFGGYEATAGILPGNLT